jgi:hypothetical protein
LARRRQHKRSELADSARHVWFAVRSTQSTAVAADAEGRVHRHDDGVCGGQSQSTRCDLRVCRQHLFFG